MTAKRPKSGRADLPVRHSPDVSVAARPSLAGIINYCDRILRTREIGDHDGALNGLQVENRGAVTKIAAAVDASLPTIRLAIAAGADLMIVHHGLFWSPRQPWTGRHYELVRTVLENNLAIYSSHLPLDVHPKFGNNVQLCKALGLAKLKPFFHSHGQAIGFKSQTAIKRSELATRLDRATGTRLRSRSVSRLQGAPNSRPLLIPGGPDVCRSIGVVTGGAGSELKLAASEGIDTFITGEGPHWTFALAEELGLNVFYAGHYATETFGVKALAAHLSKKFKLPWEFVDHPTGL